MAKRTRAEQDIERRIESHGDDRERVDVLARAAKFKRSWVELAEGLIRVRDTARHEGWGFGSFVDYCQKELHLRKATAEKLTASFGYLTEHAPEVLRRDGLTQNIPQPETVQALAKARQGEQVPDQLFRAIQDDALASDLSPASLARRFKEAIGGGGEDAVEGQRKHVDRAVTLARRLADLLADLDPRLPGDLAADVEEQLGRLISFLDEGRPARR
jgi:hypothetical protein